MQFKHNELWTEEYGSKKCACRCEKRTSFVFGEHHGALRSSNYCSRIIAQEALTYKWTKSIYINLLLLPFRLKLTSMSYPANNAGKRTDKQMAVKTETPPQVAEVMIHTVVSYSALTLNYCNHKQSK